MRSPNCPTRKMFGVIFSASQVKTREFESWEIQHNTVWTGFFSHDVTPTRKIVLFKLRRLLFNEMSDLRRSPNFKSAAILGFLLNVMGLTEGQRRDHRR